MNNYEEIIKKYGLNKDQACVVVDNSKELIVPAGAGSGKTKTLVTKVVNLLKQGNELESFLVLTFTKKAATEMKERIKKELVNEGLNQLANKIDSSNISTFDSFAFNFVKQNAALIGLDSNIELLDQAVFSTIKLTTMSNIFLETYLQDENNNIYQTIRLLSDNKNDESLINDLINVYDKLCDTRSIRSFKADDLIIEHQLFDSIDLRNKLEDISIEFCEENSDYLQQIYDTMDYLLGKIPAKPEIKKKSIKKGSFKDKEIVRTKITKLIEPYKKILTNDIEPADINETYKILRSYMESILKLLTKYEDQLIAFKQETNKYEFNDISVFLNQILLQNPDVLQRLKMKFKYVFVDEYQDTSSIQSDFLEMLIKDNEDIKVLYVGDIKQSIYKFRNAKPETFMHKLETIKQIPLSINYRSSKKIITFVNKTFSAILNDKHRFDIDYVKDNHEMESGSKAYKDDDQSTDVFIIESYTEDKSKTKYDAVEEAFIVGNKIIDLYNSKQIKDYKSVAILLRDTKSFKIFNDVFKYLNIPLQVQVDKKVKASYLLKIIANILQLSLDIKETNKDNIKRKRFNYFSVARSELFMYSDFKIFNDLIDKNVLFGSNHKLDIDNVIYQKCSNIFDAIQTKSNYEIINAVVKEFEIYKKIIYATNAIEKEYQIDYIFNIATSLSDLDITGANFVNYIHELAYNDTDPKISVLQDEEDDSVRLTNIHQSKGLEYDTLFVCGLNKKFGGKSIKKIRYGSESKITMNAKFPETNKQHVYEYLASMIKSSGMQIEQDSALKEELRLLYVALTRAKKALYLLITPKEDYSKLESFTDYLYENDVNSFVKPNNITKYTQSIKQLDYYKDLRESNMFYPDAIDRLTDNNIIIDNQVLATNKASITVDSLIDDNTKERFYLGSLIHEKFEFGNINDVDGEFNELLDVDFDNKNIQQAKKIYREFAYNYDQTGITNNGIIDLIAIYEDEVHIIDYKSNNIDQEKYQKQLKTYETYLSRIYQNITIKTFLYSIKAKKALLVTHN